MAKVPDRQDYQIAIICALGTEANAVEGILDELYETKNTLWLKADGDRNTYTTGRLGRHNVVLAHMPGIGKVNAAVTASSIRATFPNIQQGLALVVGVCGGAPQTPDGEEIYLGDVMISTSIQQADFGREHPGGFAMRDQSEGNIGTAPAEIQSFLRKLQTRKTHSTLMNKIAQYSSQLLTQMENELPDAQTDKLFPAEYLHKHQSETGPQCQVCSRSSKEVCTPSAKATCSQLGCRSEGLRTRPINRPSDAPVLIFGSISSTDAVKRNGHSRDDFAKSHKVIAFEMEGAGVWNTLPTLVIKAVSDYADSHKNKRWQEYAAINAAACCKAVIEEYIPKATEPAEQSFNILKDAYVRNAEHYLTSLNFEQLGSRFYDIGFAYSGTCDWIFQTAEFQSWLNPAQLERHHGVLWIKGKPGAGKSVLMKHIYQASQFFHGFTLAAYFFHARGTELQKSILGLYRSLLYQLLRKNNKLLEKFMAAFPTEGTDGQSWSIPELQHFLLLCSRQNWIQNTVIFIDALDECDHADARELVSFCEDLALNAVEQRSRLLICFSIRHFPNIGIKRCETLNLDKRSEHHSAIEQYVSKKIRIAELIPDIIKKAYGVFLWAVLVVQIINTTFDTGAGLSSMRQKLESIPAGLHAVFDLLVQDEQGSKEDTLLILRIVLFARRPLFPKELHELFYYSRIQDEEGEQLAIEADAIRYGTVWNFILTVSKGLIEIQEQSSDLNNGFVQFIHESVGDYLRTAAATGGLHFSDVAYSEADFHDIMFRSCLKIRYKVVINTYARDYIWAHIVALGNSELLRQNLQSFAQWWAEHYGGHTIVSDFIYYCGRMKMTTGNPRSVQLIRILEITVKDLEAIVKPKAWSRQEFLLDAIDSTILVRWLEGLAFLIETGRDIGIRETEVLDLLFIALIKDPELDDQNSIRAMTMHCLRRIMTQRLSSSCPVSLLALIQDTYLKAVHSLFGRHPLPQDFGISNTDVLYVAIFCGHTDICELLVVHGTSIDHWDKFSRSPLAMAVILGHFDIVHILLRSGGDPNTRCSKVPHTLPKTPSPFVDKSPLEETILNMALYFGDWCIAALLLAYGADPHLKSSQDSMDAFQIVEHDTMTSYASELPEDIKNREKQLIRLQFQIYSVSRTRNLNTAYHHVEEMRTWSKRRRNVRREYQSTATQLPAAQQMVTQ